MNEHNRYSDLRIILGVIAQLLGKTGIIQPQLSLKNMVWTKIPEVSYIYT